MATKTNKKDINKALRSLDKTLKTTKPEKGSGNSVPPEGTFALKIKKSEITLSKQDNAMVVYDGAIAKGANKGKAFKKFAMLTGERLAYALGDFETLGIELPKTSADWADCVAEARGLYVSGTIVHQPDGKNYNVYFNELIDDLDDYDDITDVDDIMDDDDEDEDDDNVEEEVIDEDDDDDEEIEDDEVEEEEEEEKPKSKKKKKKKKEEKTKGKKKKKKAKSAAKSFKEDDDDDDIDEAFDGLLDDDEDDDDE